MRNVLPYYFIKPFVPRKLQLHMRRRRFRTRLSRSSQAWPIDPSSGKKPVGWSGWPEGRKFALVLTHDVESALGQGRCLDLMKFEKDLGFRSSFNFVARGYKDNPDLRRQLAENGFEVGVHGLHHTGLMYISRNVFRVHAYLINKYLKQWGSVGFRSPSMYHNVDWLHDLNILYDASTFDTDPFEPQPDAVGTIFPIWHESDAHRSGYVELPYTLPQDFAVFAMLQENSIEIWKRKLDWIAEQGGMALMLTHPDYMNWNGDTIKDDKFPIRYYGEFLEYVREKYAGTYWHALPKEVAEFWSTRNLPDSMPPHHKPHYRPRPQRICMLSYSFYDSDNRVKRYAETLARRGNVVDVISLRPSGQTPAADCNGVHVRQIQKRIKNERGKFTYLMRLFGFLVRSSFHLTRSHLSHPYDVIHVHNIPDFEVFAAWLPKLTGSKIILDIHDIVPELFVDKFGAKTGDMIFRALTAIERLSAAFSDHVIVSNPIWYETYTARSADKSKCSVIINYPDPTIFSLGKYPTDSDSRQKILYPGSLNWHQGLDIAVRAFSLIKDRAPRADLHIYGDGPAKPALAEMIRTMRLEDRVCLREGLPIEEMAAIMASATCGIVPKRADGFGNQAFSTKTLEFMALGVPLIISETQIDRHYFDDNMVLFFHPGDERDLAEKMALLLENEELRSKLIRNALSFVGENNWDVKKGSYLELVDELISCKPILSPVPQALGEAK